MTDIAVSDVDQVKPLHPEEAEIYPAIALSTITAGQPLYRNSAGKVAPADANGSGLQQAIGLSLGAAAADEVVDVLKRGYCEGFTLTNQAFDDGIYVSDSVGIIADSAGTLEVPVGRIGAITELGSITKMIYFDFRHGADWPA